MRSIDRLLEYLKHVDILVYKFERTCGIANGYIKKQIKGKGTIGSEILEKIAIKFPDLSLSWLITGNGKMLVEGYLSAPSSQQLLAEPDAIYISQQTVRSLQEKILILENTIADKQKIISLLEART